MPEINNKLKEISDKINEHIVAVKGTIELADASLEEDELHALLLKAMERLDDVQKLSYEIIAVVNKLLEKLGETQNTQKLNE